MAAQPKAGHRLSEVTLAFCRALRCYGCNAPPPSQAHHYPPKGRGVTDDTRIAPLCAICHQRCHGITVVNGRRLEPVSAERQIEATNRTLRRFIDESTAEEFQKFSEDILEWKTRPGAQVPA
jgi:hypothetical protein